MSVSAGRSAAGVTPVERRSSAPRSTCCSRIGYGPRPGDIAERPGPGPRALRRGAARGPAGPRARLAPAPAHDARLLDRAGAGALQRRQPRRSGPILDEFYLAQADPGRARRGTSCQEVLVDFWFNHFNVFIDDGFDRYATPAYERDAIRPHVLGRFRDLLGATAAHPAMLFYLDNYLSTRRAHRPATGRLRPGAQRELRPRAAGAAHGRRRRRLHAGARVRRGALLHRLEHRPAQQRRLRVPRPANHDTAAKSVFGLERARRRAAGGRRAAARLPGRRTRRPRASSRASSLQRFVADDPPDAPGRPHRRRPSESTGGDIAAVVRAIVGSAEFWAEAFGAGQAARRRSSSWSARCARPTPRSTRAARSTAALAAMGMPLYAACRRPATRNRGADWLNPSSQLDRMNFALDLAAGAVAGVRGRPARAGAGASARTSGTRGGRCDALSREIFGGGLSPADARRGRRAWRPGGSVSVAARVVGLLLAGPEMQAR